MQILNTKHICMACFSKNTRIYSSHLDKNRWQTDIMFMMSANVLLLQNNGCVWANLNNIFALNSKPVFFLISHYIRYFASISLLSGLKFLLQLFPWRESSIAAIIFDKIYQLHKIMFIKFIKLIHDRNETLATVPWIRTWMFQLVNFFSVAICGQPQPPSSGGYS